MKAFFAKSRRVLRKNDLLLRIFSFLMCLVTVFTVIPSIVYAEAVDAIGSLDTTDAQDESFDIYSYTGDIYEIESQREQSAKHFHLEDGSYVAAQYNLPIHYTDSNGVLKDIDNTLEESIGGVYTNENARIKFAKKITGNETLFTLHDENTKITFNLIGANKGTVGNVTNNSDSEETTKLQKLVMLKKLSSSILYENILNGVDIEYVAEALNIKENIIIKKRTDKYSYSFELKFNGLYANLNENGDVDIRDEKSDELKYVIPSPVVYDANGEYAPNSSSGYSLVANNKKYTLTVSVSDEWMNSDHRAFPVTIDPAIVASNSGVQDTSISSAAPDTEFGDETTLTITPQRHAYWKTTELPYIPSSAYISSATITMNASLASENFVGAYEVLTDWDESLTWNQYNATVSPKGKLSSTVIDYNVISSGYYTWNITPLVEKWYSGTNYGVAFSKISGSTASLSFMSSESNAAYRPALTIIYKDMKGTEDYLSYSSQSAGVAGSSSINLATGQLTLTIPTLSTTDSLMPYTPTLIYNSSLSGLEYAYPNAEVGSNSSYTPYGFKLNIFESVIQRSYTDNTGTSHVYYIYADADGTEHGFYASSSSASVYVDEDGMQKTLNVQSSGSVTITDDTKWTRSFTKATSTPNTSISGAWHLTSITDEVGNSIIFTYDTALRPTKVSIKPNGLSQIDFLDLYYYSTGKLRMIYNSASKDAVIFRYSETYSGNISTSGTHYLRQVDYAHGNASVTLSDWENFAENESNLNNITVDATASYIYDAFGRINYAADNLAEQKISYSWLEGKLSSLSHFANTTMGQSTSYLYGSKYSDVISTGNDEVLDTVDDITTRYIFDELGRCKSVYSFASTDTKIYGATTGKYETQENIKNNLKEQTVIGGSSVNYLRNGGFEKPTSGSTVDHWSFEGAITRVETLTSDGYYYLSFAPTAGSTASITQYIQLPAGQYTFSFPYTVQSAKGITGTVTISSIESSGFLHEEGISINPDLSTGSSAFFFTSFEITEQIDNLKITVSFTASSSVTDAPTIELDRLMLENALGASEYSSVNYSNFEQSGINSFGTVNSTLSDYWTTDASSDTPTTIVDDAHFGNSIKLIGEINTERYVKQRIYEIPATKLIPYGTSDFYSNVGYEYIVSGFAKSETAVLSPNANFRIRVDVIYYQGANKSDVTISHNFDFLPSCKGWQFTSGSFNTAVIKESGDTNDYSCVKAIDIYCEFSNQTIGYALFDNIAIINANTSDVERYYYYSSGAVNGLLARKENIFYKEYYEYDDNRNLTRVANNHGELSDYSYNDGKLNSIVEYAFTWNSGNNYPFNLTDPDSLIIKTPKTKTQYSYDDYGLISSIETFAVDSELNWIYDVPKN